ncbi:MAG: 4Fe-4S binding protein [Anaerolineae bacterium]|nr:4Fe-4S binding protein [Anaerolineae bacterium]
MPEHPPPSKIPRVDPALCQACRNCVARQACKVKALLVIDPGEPPFVDGNLCYGCMACVPACPYGAIIS